VGSRSAHGAAGTVEHYSRQDWRDLVDSVRQHGVHEPLVIGSDKNGPAVWDGHHRFKAAKAAGLPSSHLLPVRDEGGALDQSIEEYWAKRHAFNAGAS
jgi:ParB-like chromosome segregation protein Spo0J